MDPDSFSAAFFKWEQRSPIPLQMQRAGNVFHDFSVPSPTVGVPPIMANTSNVCISNRKEMICLEELFRHYGVRYITMTKMMEMGFTVNTLVNMTEQELDEAIRTLVEIYRMELLVGEKYGIKSAIRAERRRLDEAEKKRLQDLFSDVDGKRKIDENALDTLSQEGLSVEEPHGDNTMLLSQNNTASSFPLNLNAGTDPVLILQNGARMGSTVGAFMGLPADNNMGDSHGHGHGNNGNGKASKKQKRRRPRESGEEGGDRQREHPFIVTEPGELARGKKNGLDYLFDLYEQCGKFLSEVQQIAKERGEKCPTKVTNQVFRHAKYSGASYINKPKMRHYVHCYALHCLDVEQSNRLRKAYKERGENVGAWRQACYYPLVAKARESDWDIDGVFNKHEKLRIWYVPTKLRQLCHLEKSKQCHL
uniref:Floricaula/leafy-like transcription factor n=1 Tax=Gnetum parvifolium TaxID=33153 RepID=Q9MBE9_GNEPA|nr:GpLFY [Gnetum parvifolium]